MAKYRALFIEESREHLGELSRLLVEVENATEPASLIDEIFRHIHSVKGMAASMGYEPIAVIAHRAEDIVASYRERRVPFDPDIIDCLLRTSDALAHQVESIAANQPLEQYVDLVRELRDWAETGSGSESAITDASPARVRTIQVDISDKSSSPSVRAFLVHRRLEENGDVLECTPPLDVIKAGKEPVHQVVFVLRSTTDDAALTNIVRGIADVEGVAISDVGAAEEESREDGDKRVEQAAESRAPVATVRVRTDVLDALIDTVGELFIARERLRIDLGPQIGQEARSSLDALGNRIREIHDQVMAVRMMPMRTLTDRYPRLVRDLCRSLKKDVELEIRGGEIELDRAILDNLDAPFVHTLRNAMDHGIESPEERDAVGKSAKGRILITASRDRDAVLVSIADDGRGLDAEALRQRAIDLELLSETAAARLSTRECLSLICRAGFSTKSEVSDVSGRGVGMDAVLASIDTLGGTLDIESEVGRGTRFTFRLPLTLVIIPVLLVESGGTQFAMPSAKIAAVRDLSEELLEQAGGQRYFSFGDSLVPVTELSEVLQLGVKDEARQLVVVEGRGLHAVAVERILGYHEVVVKPLGEPLSRLDIFAGATVLGDGQPILIIDALKVARGRGRERGKGAAVA